MRNRAVVFLALIVCAATGAHAAGTAWIEESNRYSQIALEILAKFNPESASSLGVEGHDAEVIDLKPQLVQRQKADIDAAVAQLEKARGSATDPRLQQDIDIIIAAAQQQADSITLRDRLMLPYFSVAETLYSSFQDLLDERVPKEKQAVALTRLKRYAGTERGYEPIATLARARIEERMGEASLTQPWIVEVEQDLQNHERFIKGTRELLTKSGQKGWQKDFAKLEKQLRGYGDWVRRTIVPKARKTNRLPPEIYADNLKGFGVKMDPRELIDRALLGYVQTREEMASVARVIAARRGMNSDDYHDVIRELKKQKIPNDKLLDLYKSRLAQIEDIVRKEHLVSLPQRAAVIRLGTEAESAAQPAPHIDPPRLIGNTGEAAEFVLPTSNPTSSSDAEMDDFNYDAIAWTLTAHEARPGHELQFAAMLEKGVSTARVFFAFNSANVEGWALYAEAVMRPYLPVEGQLGALQMRLMRAARAFLDPMLNLGMIEPDQAKQLLMDEVMLSEPMAKQEVDRYTFRGPGQATAYFYGYTKLEALRGRAEFALGKQFNELAYHDYIINEGLLPLDLLEKSVMERFVAPRGKGATAQ